MELIFNIGPQHPSTHGVLRLVVEVKGEVVKKVKVYIGYLHRGIEKLAETKRYLQIIPLVDRLDYVTATQANFAYMLALERLANIPVPKRAEYIRVILAELQRCASHLIWLGTQGLDLGAFTPFLYTFREREEILDIFEEYCGARMTLSLFRPGGVINDVSSSFIEKVRKFTRNFPKKIDEYEALLTKNYIWMNRMRNIGIINKEEALSWGISGPILRAAGVNLDLRRSAPYSVYSELEFNIPTGEIGDVYDRYLVRLEELRQSCKIVKDAIENIPEGKINSDMPLFSLPPKDKVKNNIEAMIRLFYLASQGFSLPKGEVYAAVEGARGELGFYIYSNGDNKPYRFHVRAPSFAHLQILEKLLLEHYVADIPAIIGSLDPVMGEVDR
jgi:NADH dehydrogenase I D subunit